MNKFPLIVLCSILAMNLLGCAPKTASKAELYPLMYEESPRTIVVLPPINESTAADAKELYACTLQEPMCIYGYYTLPYTVTTDILKMEGLYDTEILRDTSCAKFGEYFGADAVLFTTIKKWDVSYIVIASNLVISIECKLVSTKSDRTLWNYNGTILIDLSGGLGGGGLIGIIANAVATAIKTAMAEYVPYARQANYITMSTLPVGGYSERYRQDQDDQVIIQPVSESSAPSLETAEEDQAHDLQ